MEIPFSPRSRSKGGMDQAMLLRFMGYDPQNACCCCMYPRLSPVKEIHRHLSKDVILDIISLDLTPFYS
jgi:hypothetical protein